MICIERRSHRDPESILAQVSSNSAAHDLTGGIPSVQSLSESEELRRAGPVRGMAELALQKDEQIEIGRSC
jgi:hypothetical protein